MLIINIRMDSRKLLLALFLCAIAVGQKTVSVTCSTCTVSQCNSGFCYKLSGASLNETICLAAGKTCDTTVNNVQYNVNNCTYDYGSTACSTGICFYVANKKVALLGGTCTTAYTQNITCGTCVGIPCPSGNSCQTMKKGSAAPVTSCVEACANPSNVNMVIQACPNGYDAIGNQNNCCMTFDDTAGAVCSTQNSVLTASTKLKTWVKGSSNFEFHNTVLLAFILLFASLIY